jgi:hypothetical protein
VGWVDDGLRASGERRVESANLFLRYHVLPCIHVILLPILSLCIGISFTRYWSAAEDFERPSREGGSPMAVTGVRFYASGTSELVRGCGASEGVVLALVL